MWLRLPELRPCHGIPRAACCQQQRPCAGQGHRASRNWRSRLWTLESVFPGVSEETKKPPTIYMAEGARVRDTIALLRRIHSTHGRFRTGARNTVRPKFSGRATHAPSNCAQIASRSATPFTAGSFTHPGMWIRLPEWRPCRRLRQSACRQQQWPYAGTGQWAPCARCSGPWTLENVFSVDVPEETKKPSASKMAEGVRVRGTIAWLRRIHSAHGHCRTGARNTCSAGVAGRSTRDPIMRR